MLQKKRNISSIIYIAPGLSSFVRGDISFLSKKYDVLFNTYDWRNKKLVPFYMLHQIYFMLKHRKATKAIIISFGGYWSFFPSFVGRLFKIPVYIILNGADCSSIPSINYGDLRIPWLKWIIHQSYKMATLLLPVSASLIKTKNTYLSNGTESHQGYKHFFPDIRTRNIIIPNGFDVKFWRKTERTKKNPNSFIAVFSNKQFVLKGGDLILGISSKFPTCNFYIAGCEKPSGMEREYHNIHFLGKLNPVELRQYYSQCQFHFQLSIFEGFGMALCEAMLCECVPIGSSVNNIPDIIGDTGFILTSRDSYQLEEIVNKALYMDNLEELGKNARNRIINKFDSTIRKRKLMELMEQ